MFIGINFKIWGSETAETCVDKYSEGQFGHKRYCKLDFL